MRRVSILAALALGSAATAVGAQTFNAAAAFGAREDVRDVAISPDGSKVAFLRAAGTRGASVEVVAITGGTPQRILLSRGDPERIMSCRWATNQRLICKVYLLANLGDGAKGLTRQIALDADGKNVKLLSAHETTNAMGVAYDGGSVIDLLPDKDEGSVLATRVVVPESGGATRLNEQREGLAVERVDTVSLDRRIVETPRPDAVEYISDGHGAVRIMGLMPKTAAGYDQNFIDYSYRRAGERTWQSLGRLGFADGKSGGFNPYAIDRDLNAAYGMDVRDGRQALFKLALDGSMKRELIYANPDVDVDGLIRIGRANRVVGVSYVTDKRSAVFFDPALKRLGAGLARALPKDPLITFLDASADEQRLVLLASSDDDPGQYYLYDKSTRELSPLLPVRPELEKATLAKTEPISFPAADGTNIPAYLTLPAGSTGKGLPAIVMPHGGPAARDEWGFDWLVQYFANRGYAVIQPNFRGSSGYGEGWFKDNGFKSWRIAIGDVSDAGRWLVKQGIADSTKLAIVGWSYGGYAALQSAVVDPALFKAVVAIAPVTDLEMLREESAGYTNYRNVDQFIGHGAYVREGSPAQNAARIKVPVLMFHGENDQNVGIGESRLMADRLKGAGGKVELMTYPKLDHQLDDSQVRSEMLAKSDAFLRTTMGMK